MALNDDSLPHKVKDYLLLSSQNLCSRVILKQFWKMVWLELHLIWAQVKVRTLQVPKLDLIWFWTRLKPLVNTRHIQCSLSSAVSFGALSLPAGRGCLTVNIDANTVDTLQWITLVWMYPGQNTPVCILCKYSTLRLLILTGPNFSEFSEQYQNH